MYRPCCANRLVLALLVTVLLAVAGCNWGGESYRFTLAPDPSGSAGVLPEELRLQVGDRVEILNNDVVPRAVGGLTLPPGERLTQQFDNAGTFEYACSIHASGRFRVVVAP